MSVKLEVELRRIEDASLIGSMISNRNAAGADKIVIKPFDECGDSGYEIEYSYPARKINKFYPTKK